MEAENHPVQEEAEPPRKRQRSGDQPVDVSKGVAWRQVEHQVDELMDDADGFKKTLELLDAAFRYDARVEMPRALEKFFYSISRKSDQTLLTYASDHREALREVEKHGIQIPDNVSGWLLLRRSGLTTEQKQLIQSRCGDLKDYEVEQAMYYLLGQDYKTRVQPMMGGKGRRHRWQRSGQGYVAEEDAYYDDEWDYVDDLDEDAYYEELDGGSYTEAETYEDPYAYDESALYEMEDGDYQDDWRKLMRHIWMPEGSLQTSKLLVATIQW